MSSFNTNKYTRPVLTAEIRQLNTASFVSISTLAKAISPRAGVKSAKISALREFTKAHSSYSLTSMFKNNTANQVKVILLNALQY